MRAQESTQRQLQFDSGASGAAPSAAAAAAAAKHNRKRAAPALADYGRVIAASSAVTAVLCSLLATQMTNAATEPAAPAGAFKCDFKTPVHPEGADGTVVVSVLVRNGAARVDPFFNLLAAQSFPKARTCLLVSTDNNLDDTEARLDAWVAANRASFAGIEYVKPGNNATLADAPSGWEKSEDCAHRPHCWEQSRTKRVSQARDAAYRRALESGARYFASVDSDVLLGDATALERMVESMPTPAGVVAMQLLSSPNTWDSNVWLETDDDGFYTRGRFQLSFRSRAFTGCVRAQAVHSFFAVDLRAPGAERLEFFTERRIVPEGRLQTDIATMSRSAIRAGVPVWGCNTFSPGLMPSVAGGDSFTNTQEAESALFTRLANKHARAGQFSPEEFYEGWWPVIDESKALGCDLTGSSPSCDCPRDVSQELQAQIDEMRNATLAHLDRMQVEGHASVCSWNGDCSDRHFVVDKRSNLSLEEFHANYSMMRRPVVITDYLKGPDGNHLDVNGEYFDSEFWKRTCGEKHFSIMRAAKAQSWGGLVSHSVETLNRSFEVLDDPNLDPTVYGIFDSPLTRSCPKFLETFKMPKYFANDYLQRVSHDVTLTYRDSWPSFFLGRGGTNANLHIDMFGSSFWMAVFEGKKHWRFVDGSQRHLLYENRPTNDFPDVDLFNPDYERFPLLRHVRTFDVVLEPGDLLFVPGGSPHQVRNVDGAGKSISLAGNYIDAGSLETAREECDHHHRGTYSRYAEIVRTVLNPKFPQGMDLDAGDMTWKEWKAQATWSP